MNEKTPSQQTQSAMTEARAVARNRMPELAESTVVVESFPSFTQPAGQRWECIPADIRQRLLSKVWCGQRRRESAGRHRHRGRTHRPEEAPHLQLPGVCGTTLSVTSARKLCQGSRTDLIPGVESERITHQRKGSSAQKLARRRRPTAGRRGPSRRHSERQSRRNPLVVPASPCGQRFAAWRGVNANAVLSAAAFSITAASSASSRRSATSARADLRTRDVYSFSPPG